MKIRQLLALAPLSLVSAFALAGCDSGSEKRVLRILNCEDYIYEYEDGDEENSSGGLDYKYDMIEQFEKYWEKDFKTDKQIEWQPVIFFCCSNQITIRN